VATATVTSKGQITLPVKVRAALSLSAGDRVEFIEMEKGRFVMVPVTRSVRELKGMLYDKRRKPVSIEEMNEAIGRNASRLHKAINRR
jgi:AbrB family looped-hinge helix DNA binding protein